MPARSAASGSVSSTRRLLEVGERRLADPVGAVPEVDRVQVRRQDPVLLLALLQLPGERGLLQLAGHGPLVFDVGVLDELLRDRRAALDDRLVLDVGRERAPDRPHVDAAVVVEALVLDGDDRLLHDRGDLVGLQDHAALLAAQHREQLALAVEDVAVVRDLLLVRGVVLRELAGDRGHHAEDERGEREQAQHRDECEEAELADSAPVLLRRRGFLPRKRKRWSLVALPVMPSSYWVASTKPEAALARRQY